MSTDKKYCIKLEKCECGESVAHPDLSHDEQYAGYHDVDGSKVYTRTYDLGIMPTNSLNQFTSHPHEISNFNRLVKMDFIWESGGKYHDGYLTGGSNGSHLMRCFCDATAVYTSQIGWTNHRGIVTIYYTCTDR